MNKTMTEDSIQKLNKRKTNIVNQFKVFIKEPDSASEQYINSGKQLLQDICVQGRYLSSPVERNQFAQMARDVNKRLFELTDEYLPARLETLNQEINQSGTHIPRTIPLELPQRPVYFTDRQQELEQLLHNLRPGHIITICGPGGIGKSALAAEAVWRLTDNGNPPEQFPDGVIWHDFYTRPKTEMALEHIALAFGEKPTPTPFDAAQRALSGKRALLFLDGTEDTDDLLLIQKITGRCGVIVTSRKKRDAAAERQDIESLDPDEAVKLFMAWGKQAGNETTSRRICELVGGLPLAVRLAGRYIAETGETAEEYLEFLEETPLDALNQGDRKLESVTMLLKSIIEQISESSRNILALCGVLAFSPFSRKLVETASETQIKHPLNELINYSLVTLSGEHYKLSHAMIHTFARNRLTPPDGVTKRLISYYTAFANKQTESTSFKKLDAERTHIIAILHKCTDYQAVLNLIWSIKDYCMFQGYWNDFLSALNYGITASRNLKNLREEANCIYVIGDVHRLLDEYKEACIRYEEAYIIYKQIEDRLGEANCIHALGDIHIRLSEYEQGRTRYENAHIIYKKIGHRLGEADSIKALGDVHMRFSEYGKARSLYEKAISIYRQIRDRLGEADSIKALGDVDMRLSEYGEAHAWYEEARLIYRQIGVRRGEANCIHALGDIRRMLDEYEEARTRYEEAHFIYKRIGDQLGEANSIKTLGDIHRMLDEYEEARTQYEEAHIIYKQIGDHLGEANCIHALGDIHKMLDGYGEARTWYEEASTIYSQIGYRLGEANCIQALGDVHIILSEYDEASTLYEKAKSIFSQIGAHLGEANCMKALGDVHRILSEYDEARMLYEEARLIYNQIGDHLGETNCIQGMGDVHRMLDEYEEARIRYEEASAIYSQIGDRLGKANCIKKLGDVHRMLDEYEEARIRYEEASTIYSQIEDRHNYAATLAYLGLTFKGLKQTDQARQHLQESVKILGEIRSPASETVKKWLTDLRTMP